jgi:hypothetical protein
MFRITRGHTIQHAPAFPSPAFRFPDGTPIPIYAEDEHDGAPESTPQQTEPPAPVS